LFLPVFSSCGGGLTSFSTTFFISSLSFALASYKKRKRFHFALFEPVRFPFPLSLSVRRARVVESPGRRCVRCVSKKERARFFSVKFFSPDALFFPLFFGCLCEGEAACAFFVLF
jgi:hypothetical protein